MTDWYYADASRQRQGPWTSEELGGHFQHGRISLETLVWREGMAEWQPLRTRADELELPALAAIDFVAPPLADASPDAWDATTTRADAPYAPPVAHIAPEQQYVAGGEVVLAGFWRRLAALFLDAMIVGFAYYLVMIIGVIVLGVGGALMMRGSGDEGMGAMVGMMAAVYLMYPVISAAYYAGFESSSKQATLGKMAVGIKVTDIDGRRLTLARALGRWLAAGLNYLTLYIGYLMAAFTDRKQGLHDKVAATLVVDRWAFTSHADWQQRGLGTVTKVILAIAGVLYGLMFVAVLAAVLIPMIAKN